MTHNILHADFLHPSLSGFVRISRGARLLIRASAEMTSVYGEDAIAVQRRTKESATFRCAAALRSAVRGAKSYVVCA